MRDLGREHPLYSISVTSELTGVQPQVLRTYEDKGLLAPFRTKGGTRRYSVHDLDRIGQISSLLATGLNLTGVQQVLHLQAETHRLQHEAKRLRAELNRLRQGSAESRRRRAWDPNEEAPRPPEQGSSPSAG
jgi:MerR family transcriptional regulator/heat shock protein HspR